MKRDIDLVRQILSEMESRKSDDQRPMQFDGWSDEEISYHIMLLCQANLIETTKASTRAGPCLIPLSLTWEGHEFLDAARDDTRWNKMKSMVKEKAGAVGFEVIKQVLVVMAKQTMGL
jgi:hypothetical protein